LAYVFRNDDWSEADSVYVYDTPGCMAALATLFKQIVVTDPTCLRASYYNHELQRLKIYESRVLVGSSLSINA
jgi:hypothetical protein